MVDTHFKIEKLKNEIIGCGKRFTALSDQDC